MRRQSVVTLHLMLASCLMTLALVFVVSGMLYTFDIKGSVQKQVFTVPLAQPFTPQADRLEAVVRQALQAHGLPLPKGDIHLKKKKKGYVLYWRGLRYAVKLKQGETPMQAVLVFRERSLLTQLMRIHRGEAGTMFRILSLVLGLGLLALFVSGAYLAYSIPRYRKPMLQASSAGLLLFLLLLYAA